MLFIVGAPRSGSSLLYKALCLHPDSAWISNYCRRLPAVPAVSVLNRWPAHRPEARHRIWFGADGRNAYAYTRDRRFTDWAFPQPTEGEPFFTTAGFAEDGTVDRPTLARRRLRHRVRSVQRWSGGGVLVNKRIGHNRRIPQLADALPEARFVHLVRDVRAVARSIVAVDWWAERELWWHDPLTTPGELGRVEDRTLAAQHWAAETDAATAGLAAIAATRGRTLHYEELIADPLATLGSIAAFGGLDPDDERWSRALAQISFPDRNERWRTDTDAEVLARIDELSAPARRLHGYDGSAMPPGRPVPGP